MKNKLITALVTPFDKNNMIDKKEMKKLIKDVVAQGSDGIVLGGTTGEGSSLTEEELIELIEISNECSECEKIINVGLNNTDKTINLINKIKNHKHDALMVIVPYYNKPNKQGIYEHFKKIADTFKEEKFILYNVPSRTIVKLESETLLRLIDECSNIIGLKHASNDYDLVDKVKEKYPDFIIYSGDDKNTLEILKHGGNGVISVMSHIFGSDLKELLDDYSNNIENTILDKYIKEISEILFCDTNPIPIKYALSKRGYKSMNLRLPLTDLELSKHQNIDIILSF